MPCRKPQLESKFVIGGKYDVSAFHKCTHFAHSNCYRIGENGQQWSMYGLTGMPDAYKIQGDTHWYCKPSAWGVRIT